VAVFLGWVILPVAVPARTIAAGVLILGAVLLIQLAPGAPGRRRALAPELPAAAPRRGEAGA
jgi:hypothetical protein